MPATKQGDQDEAHLAALSDDHPVHVANELIRDLLNGVHLLPFSALGSRRDILYVFTARGAWNQSKQDWQSVTLYFRLREKWRIG
jgi:hypothetical protein